MNAYELADFVEISKPDDKSHQMIATMLRHQADYIKHLEEGLESSINLNKAQAERQVKELTDEEILEVFDNTFKVRDFEDYFLKFARAILSKAQEK
jgi:hypothetical protein